MNNLRCTTHNIANMGFSGKRRFVARLNFSCTLIGNHPQSHTGHIVKRCAQLPLGKIGLRIKLT